MDKSDKRIVLDLLNRVKALEAKVETDANNATTWMIDGSKQHIKQQVENMGFTHKITLLEQAIKELKDGTS